MKVANKQILLLNKSCDEVVTKVVTKQIFKKKKFIDEVAMKRKLLYVKVVKHVIIKWKLWWNKRCDYTIVAMS